MRLLLCDSLRLFIDWSDGDCNVGQLHATRTRIYLHQSHIDLARAPFIDLDWLWMWLVDAALGDNDQVSFMMLMIVTNTEH